MTWLRLLVPIGALSVSACGGKVIFDDGGDGGSGSVAVVGATGTSTHTSTHAASSTTGGNQCAALLADMQAKAKDATHCNPLLDIQQCDGTAIINDSCGCPSILANEKNPNKVSSAQAAYQAWVSAGCGPMDCDHCSPAIPGFCNGTNETNGNCSSAIPD